MTRFDFVKEMGKRELLVPHLNAWFNRAKFPETIEFSIRLHKEPDTAFHPSSDASMCATQLYAKKMGDLEKRELNGTSYKTFMAGHYWHEVIQYILVQELGFSDKDDIEKQQTKYRPTGPVFGNIRDILHSDHWQGRSRLWWARGFIDVAHCHIPGKGDYLVDIKTMGSHTYRPEKMPLDLWNKYYAQMQLYLDWENQNTCILLCVEKDSPHRFKEFIIERDPVFVETIYQRWDDVTYATIAQTPPLCDIHHPRGDECPCDAIYGELEPAK